VVVVDGGTVVAVVDVTVVVVVTGTVVVVGGTVVVVVGSIGSVVVVTVVVVVVDVTVVVLVVVDAAQVQSSVTACPTALARRRRASLAATVQLPSTSHTASAHASAPTAARSVNNASVAVGKLPWLSGCPQSPTAPYTFAAAPTVIDSKTTTTTRDAMRLLMATLPSRDPTGSHQQSRALHASPGFNADYS